MDDSRSSLSQPRPDVVARSLRLSLDRSRQRHFMPAAPSPCSVNNTSLWIWCSVNGYLHLASEPRVVDLETDNQDPIHEQHGKKVSEAPKASFGSDPFGLDDLINKRSCKPNIENASMTPKFPPGFSPINDGSSQNSASSHNCKLESSKIQSGFSMIERLEETIKVGLALGLNMDGCEKTLASLIAGTGDFKIRQLWGNMQFDFASSSARGLSGGILCVWNNLVFKKSCILCTDNYVVVEGVWIPTGSLIMWVAVYAPQDITSKVALWSSLSNHIASWNGCSIIMGDFNEVRVAVERFGSIFNRRHSDIFNSFISSSSLIEVPLGGYKYTWINKLGIKMSLLDRFLTSESFHNEFPHVTRIVLEKGIPDHRPILLKELEVDYGPIPFRFYHSWLKMEGFRDMVVDAWSHDGIDEENGFLSFKKKLQHLKIVIREWVKSKKLGQTILKVSTNLGCLPSTLRLIMVLPLRMT
nr:RNA-directed DNA polymerase, eukaryota [Tanacetum cinerariifolium]